MRRKYVIPLTNELCGVVEVESSTVEGAINKVVREYSDDLFRQEIEDFYKNKR